MRAKKNIEQQSINKGEKEINPDSEPHKSFRWYVHFSYHHHQYQSWVTRATPTLSTESCRTRYLHFMKEINRRKPGTVDWYCDKSMTQRLSCRMDRRHFKDTAREISTRHFVYLKSPGFFQKMWEHWLPSNHYLISHKSDFIAHINRSNGRFNEGETIRCGRVK